MKKVVNITNQPKQLITLQTEYGEDILLTMEYKPRVEGWFFSFQYKDLTAKNLQVCIHPNILRQFRRNIDFGIGFVGDTKAEPFSIDAFTTGKCGLYLLTSEDVKTVEMEIFNEQMGI